MTKISSFKQNRFRLEVLNFLQFGVFGLRVCFGSRYSDFGFSLDGVSAVKSCEFQLAAEKSSKVAVRRTHMARLGVSKKKKSPRATELSELKKELQRVTEQLESRDREQTATSEILRIIANSATNLQPVLDAVAENAARLIGAQDAIIHRLDGDVLRDAAHYGLIPRTPDTTTPLTRDSVAGRAAVDRQLVHVTDLQAESDAEFSLAKARAVRDGTRSVLGAPLLREVFGLERFSFDARKFNPLRTNR
jgi:hypothetical protein